MKKIITYLILFPILGGVGYAQQSLFNVPSISITKKKEVFFQEQVNVTFAGTSLNFNTAYGLGHEFELGINVVGVGVEWDKNVPVLITNSTSKDQVPYAPLVMMTGLKAFSIGEHYKIGFGGQVGLNPTQNNFTKDDVATFDYINNRVEIPKLNLMLCAGAYYSNLVYLGQRDQFGGMCGFELVIIEHKFLLMGDWIIGQNAVSVAVPGFVYHPHHNIALSGGWQIPSPGSGNPQGFVFELTLGNFSSK